jgi:hypothetical protein
MPCVSSQQRADGSSSEIANHIKHVKAAARVGSESVNARLVRDMSGLRPKVKQQNADDKPGEGLAGKPKQNVRDDDRGQGKTHGESRAVLVGEAANNRSPCSASRSYETKEARHLASVVIRGRFEQENKRGPKRAEAAKQASAQEGRFAKLPVRPDQFDGRAEKLKIRKLNDGLATRQQKPDQNRDA